jgi:flagellar motor protein MotB
MTHSPLLFVAAAALLAAGCQNKLHDENLALHQQNRELQAQLNERDQKLQTAPDPAQMTALQQQVADRDSKIRELEANLKKPAAGAPADPTLAGIETTYDPKAGTVTVNVPGDVLFDAGKAMLRPTALGTLNKIATAIKKDYSGKNVQVDGYTDSDPISKTKDQWDDNWDLSYARAKAVMQYLTTQGVDAKRVSIVANGSNKPKGSKPASRRVEIVVFAK